MQRAPADDTNPFPSSAGVLFGLGLGGFFDGIVLHQLLQWHHMVSGWYPVSSLDNLALNTTWDGIFHSLTYLFIVAGLFVAWRASQRARLRWSSVRFIGLLLMGWGLFNVVEGLIDHQLLGIHRVNETVPEPQRIYWDIGFLAWGAVMLIVGWVMARTHTGRSDADIVSRPQ